MTEAALPEEGSEVIAYVSQVGADGVTLDITHKARAHLFGAQVQDLMQIAKGSIINIDVQYRQCKMPSRLQVSSLYTPLGRRTD